MMAPTCSRSPTERNKLEPESPGVNQEAAVVIGHENANHHEDQRWDQNSSRAMLAVDVCDPDNNDTTIWFLLRVVTYYLNSHPHFVPRKVWNHSKLFKATQSVSPSRACQRVFPWLTQCPNLHSGAGILASQLQARNGFDQCRVQLSGEVHKTVPLFQGPRNAPVERCSPQSMSSEHRWCYQEPPYWTSITLDLTRLVSDIQIKKVDDNSTQSNSFKREESSNDWMLSLWV